jgi:hypothetical protein
MHLPRRSPQFTRHHLTDGIPHPGQRLRCGPHSGKQLQHPEWPVCRQRWGNPPVQRLAPLQLGHLYPVPQPPPFSSFAQWPPLRPVQPPRLRPAGVLSASDWPPTCASVPPWPAPARPPFGRARGTPPEPPCPPLAFNPSSSRQVPHPRCGPALVPSHPWSNAAAWAIAPPLRQPRSSPPGITPAPPNEPPTAPRGTLPWCPPADHTPLSQ